MNNTTTTPAIPAWTFGDRLRKARRQAGLEQAQLAKKLGVSTASVSGWEADTNKPRRLMAVAQQVAEVTGVDQLWLLGLTDGNNDPRDFQMKFSLAA
jgi:transcriptional regulator with XRE-family HTH domain